MGSTLREQPGARFTIGDRGSFGWAQIPVIADSRSIFNTKRAQEPIEQSVFTYRAALGGFGVKPSKLPPAEAEAAGQPDAHTKDDDASDAGSIFSEEEGRRRERAYRDAQYTALLPGYEEDGAGVEREKAHLRRVLTSADGLYPVRNSFKRLGINTLNYFVYNDDDPAKLMATIAADIYTGLWSCCRKTNPGASGCAGGTHSSTKSLCTRCGVLFDPSTNKNQQDCFYHPGALNRSRAGGVWWTCCGAVGFKNSLLHSSGGDLGGAQDFRWGCKKDQAHVPLVTFDSRTDPKKYVHCTYGEIGKVEALGPNQEPPLFHEDTEWVGTGENISSLRIAAMTCVAQPLLPVILGLQLQYEVVTDLEVFDGDRHVGNPGPISDRDHLRKIREEKLVFENDEFIIRIQMEYNEKHVQQLTVTTNTGRNHVFFEKWKLDNDEKSLKDMQSEQEETKKSVLKAPDGHRVVGLRYGVGDNLKCLGLLTQRLVAYNPETGDLTSGVSRCTLCAQFFFPPDSKTAQGRILRDNCKFHIGFWTPQRRVRLADNSTLPKCGAMCEAKSCGKSCKKYQHRSHVMVHSCGDSRCAETCDMQGCTRRCSTQDHFHGTNDPMAIHTCGGSHPCKTPCVCGKPCKFVAARGESVHTWHWCGSSEGCSKRCSVLDCTNKCIHPNHHHHLEEDCFHHCGNEHPCLETCSAEGCSSKCYLDREHRHKHQCHNPHKLGCRVRCSVDDCVELCADPDHFHADHSSFHKCAEQHPCRRLCSAPGCKSACALSRETRHDNHQCSGWHKLRCASDCSVPGCLRPCANIDHFHGNDIVEFDGKMVPKQPHLCNGRHNCGKKCSAFGCLSSCTVDKSILGHQCMCDGHVGCRHPCWFSAQSVKCRNFCSSEDHIHEAEFHLCGNDHACKAFCARVEPCVLEGGKKRQRKICTKVIPSGQTKHEGNHDCGGKHARPVEFTNTGVDAGVRCTLRCDKPGCRRRCIFGVSDSDHTLVVDGVVLHVCDEVMCLEPCPHPKCKRICNLPHDHAIVDDHSWCGCCELHRKYAPEPALAADSAAADTAEDDDVAMSAGKGAGSFGSARAVRMIAQKKLANEIGAAKASGQRPLKTKRAPAQESMASCCPLPGSAADALLDDQAAQPYYHGWGANVRKYGSHFQRYTNVAPLEREGVWSAQDVCVPGSAPIRPQPKPVGKDSSTMNRGARAGVRERR